MSTETAHLNAGTSRPEAGEMRLEVVIIPVADVARAQAFYSGLGWRLDADVAMREGGRLVQFTPTGSLCSIQFGTDLTSAAPGSSQSLYLVVPDVDAARDALVSRGADVSEVFHEEALGDRFEPDTRERPDGPARDHQTYGSFATFSDPDGNGWLLQEVTTRLPGR
jgi:catechol 2,3-dioxygenase-like lactoylglutathione lyase family enzyme